ncbi:MAG: hypothetical protein ACREPM_07020, partial [Gemmatimonadaceae bacterium]
AQANADGARIGSLVVTCGRSVVSLLAMRRPSAPLRFARALVGLVTLWCLGCSSYEPILESLLGGTTMMACDSEVGASSASTAGAADHGQSRIAASTDARNFDCGCGGSCYAPSLAPATVSIPRASVAAVDQQQPSAPIALTRAPLLPPPEITA